MGSGASSDVKPVGPDGNDRVPGPPAFSFRKPGSRPTSGSRPASGSRRVTPSESVDLPEPVQPFQPEPSEGLRESKDDNEMADGMQSDVQRIQELETQMAALESENLDLQEQVQALQDRLEVEHAESMAKDDAGCEQTVKIKDTVIRTLEINVEELQKELHKLKVRYKKKLKLLNGQLAEAKHEGSLQVFEIKDEVTRLKEENDRLTEELNNQGQSSVERPLTAMSCMSGGLDGSGTFDGSRTKVIVQLSAKVSEQESRIQELAFDIQQRDETIATLRNEIASLSVTDHKGRPPLESKSKFRASLRTDVSQEEETFGFSSMVDDDTSRFASADELDSPSSKPSSWAAHPPDYPRSRSEPSSLLSRKSDKRMRLKPGPKADKPLNSFGSTTAMNGSIAGGSRDAQGLKGFEKRISSATSSGFSDCDSILSADETGLVTVAELSDSWDDSEDDLASPVSPAVKSRETQKTKLNPSNVRKISAPKGKRHRKGIEADVGPDSSADKPPMYGGRQQVGAQSPRHSPGSLNKTQTTGLAQSRTVAVSNS